MSDKNINAIDKQIAEVKSRINKDKETLVGLREKKQALKEARAEKEKKNAD